VSKLIECKHCGHNVAKTARACPKCGGPLPKQESFAKGCLLLIILMVLALIGLHYYNKNRKPSGKAQRGTSIQRQDSPQESSPDLTTVSSHSYFLELNKYAHIFQYVETKKLTFTTYSRIAWKRMLTEYLSNHKLADNVTAQRELEKTAELLLEDKIQDALIEIKKAAKILCSNSQDVIKKCQKSLSPVIKVGKTIRVTTFDGQFYKGKIEKIDERKIVLNLGNGIVMGVNRKKIPFNQRIKIWKSDRSKIVQQRIQKMQSNNATDMLKISELEPLYKQILAEGRLLKHRNTTITYTVINIKKKLPEEIIIDIRLLRRGTKVELTSIAKDLRKQYNKKICEKLFISYYLPGMKEEDSAWASSNYIPNLDIRISE
jgi:hypothetical protein